VDGVDYLLIYVHGILKYVWRKVHHQHAATGTGCMHACAMLIAVVLIDLEV
jgi:hypothetical protein